mmetsp:Transcript_5168/g.7962  ORF Transcript_5168/g.7962 Transcript_5168/m.7962 type:complete len:210 (+) Transcript_5168:6380-7009(+)
MGHLKEYKKYESLNSFAKKKQASLAKASTTFEDLERRIQQLEQIQFSDAWSYILTQSACKDVDVHTLKVFLFQLNGVSLDTLLGHGLNSHKTISKFDRIKNIQSQFSHLLRNRREMQIKQGGRNPVLEARLAKIVDEKTKKFGEMDEMTFHQRSSSVFLQPTSIDFGLGRADDSTENYNSSQQQQQQTSVPDTNYFVPEATDASMGNMT